MNRKYKMLPLLLVALACHKWSLAQDVRELNSGWRCTPQTTVKEDGATISLPSFSTAQWIPAVVPGTVLTTQLQNQQIPDPWYGMNNQQIPDIYTVGREYYTYWFVKDVEEVYPVNGQQVWLQFRGVNYSCDIYYNGHKLNAQRHKGMFLRQEYNITAWMKKNGHNRLAVIVYPPDMPGNANGGQGGDGVIARNVTHQYVAGWDWIQPIRDRNTGIWDKVLLRKTKQVHLTNPHIVTLVPGIRQLLGVQQPAVIKVSAELYNPTATRVEGVLQYVLDKQKVTKKVVLLPGAVKQVQLPDLVLQNPRLWWPNTYGPQHLYQLPLQFLVNGTVLSDADSISFGVREIQTSWNSTTQSRQIAVNGQKIFIKGGNWIASDAMLRFSPQRYDAEVRFHRDMNLNLIRVWGGALTERPEFYQACDKYGLLVMQDFWISGDCNGKWSDPTKKDDQSTRRQYPDDHSLFIASAADQVKLIRNHPSLAFWCGGNEILLPADIEKALKDSVMPLLDGTRWFVDYSNSDSMSHKRAGENGDGPYGIQPITTFWKSRTWPFNSEVGSVGLSDYESLQRFIPESNMNMPEYSAGKTSGVDSVWDYHKYISYDTFINAYGKPEDVQDFTRKAQLVNYDQYRGLMEGFSAHAWDWYTGVIIWKTQNPWTAMRGQMYDYYLDPNACLYGLRKAGEVTHVMLNLVDSTVLVKGRWPDSEQKLQLVARLFDKSGKDTLIATLPVDTLPEQAKSVLSLAAALQEDGGAEGVFVSLQLLDRQKQVVSDNFYWLPGADGSYTALQNMKMAEPEIHCKRITPRTITVTLQNPAGGPVAFFNRVSLIDGQTQKRILPVFYTDNYISVLPGEQKSITLEYSGVETNILVSVEGWNSIKTFNTISNEK